MEMRYKAFSVATITLLLVLSAVGAGTSIGGVGPPIADGPAAGVQAAIDDAPPAQQTQSTSALAPRGRWNPTTSTGEIILDSNSAHTVFQGERDITRWRRASDNSDVSGRTLSGQSGAAEGEALSLDGSIPRDQTTGRYAGNQLTATVVQPRISSMTVVNPNGVELGNDVSVGSNQKLLLQVRWNYVQAEDIQVDLVRNGINQEREAFSTSPSAAQASRLPSGFSGSMLGREIQGSGSTGYSTASWLFDFSDLESGTYTLRVEGVDDLTSGTAAQTMTVRVGTSGSPSLSLDQRSASRGQDVKYTITGSDAGNFHAVSVPRDRLRSNADPNRVFRRVGDVVQSGSTSNVAYGVVEIPDRGVGVGTVDTGLLDTGTTRLTLHSARSSASDAASSVSSSGVRTQSLDVSAGSFSTNLGTFPYAIGSRVDVRGTAEGANHVALYVRDGGGTWRLLTLNGRERTSVSSTGTWSATGVTLSQEGPGGTVLSLPGSYRLAVVDAGGFSGTPPNQLSSTELGRHSNAQTLIRTTTGSFNGRVTTYGGEVAQSDRTTVTGVAAGTSQVALVFVDERGGIRTTTVSVQRDNTFQTQLTLDNLERGGVTALIAVPGRDGVYGSGSARAPDGTTIRLDSASAFTRYAEAHRNRGLTGEQVVARLEGNVLSATASDDQVARQRLRLAPPRTTIRDVVPANVPNAAGVQPIALGETMLVRGQTNRNPRDTAIGIEVGDGPSGATIDAPTVRTWTEDGTWTAQIRIPSNARTGTYTLRTDDGASTATREIDIVSQRQSPATPTERPEPTPTERPTTPTPTERPAPTPTDRPTTPTSTPMTDTETEGGGPGFGVVAALVALLTALLVVMARRRRRE